MPYFPAEPLKDEEHTYAAHLGAAIIQWNAADWDIRQLLSILTKDMHVTGPHGSWLLIVELGSRQLSQAIQTYADLKLKDDEAEAVRHIALIYDQLLTYRNYYVHGIIAIRPIEPERTGVISTRSAKGKLVEYSDEVTIDQLNEFIERVEILRRYVHQVQLHLIDIRHHPEVAQALPQKPPLLPTLVKRRPGPSNSPTSPLVAKSGI